MAYKDEKEPNFDIIIIEYKSKPIKINILEIQNYPKYEEYWESHRKLKLLLSEIDKLGKDVISIIEEQINNNSSN